MSEEDDAPRELRDRRYRGLRVLGQGAQATTFEATDVVVGRQVAIKRFVVRGARTWKEVELAEREAAVLASITHPLLPGYVEHFEEGGALYLVTSRIEGESLHALRRRGGRLDEAEIARMLRNLGDVLGYLHGRAPPIVHRDVKPGNIIRTPEGRFVLVDFGAVRDRLKPDGGSTVVGTFGYMAPEQFQGRAMPQSDVYGAGATALAMLTGVEPEELPHRGLAIDVRAALDRRAPEALIHALERMLEPDPDRRAARVPALLHGEAPPPGRFRDGGPERRRERKKKARAAHDDERTRRGEDRRRRDRATWRRRVRIAGGLSRVVVGIGLLLATIGVQIACRVVVPTVLVILSVIFGEPLRRAARQVAEAGVRATRAIDRARELARGLRLPDEEHDLDPEPEDAATGGPRVHVPGGRAPVPGEDPGRAATRADAEAQAAAAAEVEAAEAEAAAEAARAAHRTHRRGR